MSSVVQIQQPRTTPSSTWADEIVLGYSADTGDPGANQTALAAALAALGADGYLFAGDGSYNGDGEVAADWLALETALGTLNIWPAIGNHDQDSTSEEPAWLETAEQFYHAFNTAAVATDAPVAAYSKVFGGGLVELFVINSGRDTGWNIEAASAIGSAQYTWLASQVAQSTARWKILMMHHPPATAATAANRLLADVQYNFKGLGIDLILCGHIHANEHITVGGVDLLNLSAPVQSFGTLGASLAAGSQSGSALQWTDAATRLFGKIVATKHLLRVECIDIADASVDREIIISGGTGAVYLTGYPAAASNAPDEFSREVWGDTETVTAAERHAGYLPRGLTLNAGIRLSSAGAGTDALTVQVKINGTVAATATLAAGESTRLINVADLAASFQNALVAGGSQIKLNVTSAPTGYDIWTGLEVALLGEYQS